jgi:short-subunit dehydrogenase
MNKHALITGTSRGLGLETAKHFLSKGWSVTGISRTQSLTHSNYQHFSADISNRDELAKAISHIHSDIDLLINNAAVFSMQPFSSESINNIEQIIDINLKGNIYTTKFCLRQLRNGSKIIFINSVAGLSELENQSIYCAAKHGLTAFAGVIGKELRAQGIKVASIHPGGINTSLWNASNPYPCGPAESAMPAQAVIDVIDFIVNSPYDIDYKTVKLFPSIEWH